MQQQNNTDIDTFFVELAANLQENRKPSEFLNANRDDSAMQEYPLYMLQRLQKTEQSPQHHPEGSVWNHTLLVIDQAAKVKNKSKNPQVFMWAALLHEIGKPPTTKVRKGKITSYDHDQVGALLAEEFLHHFGLNDELISAVSALVRYHMQPLFVLKDLPFADIQGMKATTDMREVALLGLCDRIGRAGSNPKNEHENYRAFLKKVKQEGTAH